jgi:hypothetical protein
MAGAYVVDVHQVLADPGMKAFWRANFVSALDWQGVLDNLFSCFSNTGSGYLFQMIFGVLGTLAFFRAILKGIFYRDVFAVKATDWLRSYAALLITVVFILFLAGRLPLGEPRLNAFIIPSVALLVIDLLQSPAGKSLRRTSTIVVTILFLGVGGNIISVIVATYTDSDISNKRKIYFSIAAAIRDAKALHLPILATPAVAYPYQTDPNLPDTLHKVPGDWILKTHPAYHLVDHIPVYAISKPEDAVMWLDTTVATGAVVCNGASYSTIRKQ